MRLSLQTVFYSVALMMAVNASPTNDELCHTVYGTTAVQAARPCRRFESGAGAKFSDEPSKGLSYLVPGVGLPPYNSSLTSTASCVHVGQWFTAPAKIDVSLPVNLGVGAKTKTQTPALPQVSSENCSATLLQHGLADEDWRPDDMFADIQPPRSGKIVVSPARLLGKGESDAFPSTLLVLLA